MIDAVDNPLPQNPDAERKILAAVILDNGVAPQALHELAADDMSSESHRRIFRAMRSLESQNRAINPETLVDELRKMESLDYVGGVAYVASLIDGAVRFSDIRDYVALVKEAALKRQAINTARWLLNESFAPDTRVEDLLASLRAKVESLEEGRIVDDLISSETAVDRAMTNLEDAWATGNIMRGLPTGLPDLDKALLGLRKGKYYVLAAGTGIGKTALALSIGNAVVEADPESVGLIISLEMPVDELVVRRLATATQIDSYRIETGMLTDQEKDFIREAAQRVRRIRLEYVEGFSKVTASSIVSRVHKIKRRFGRLDFLVVDYLQLLDAESRGENENARLSEISRALKRITLNFNIPVLVLSQLNREHMKRANKDYILSDLRGSGSIEQDADVVMFLMPESWDEPENPGRRLKIEKYRGGKSNQTVPLIFFGNQYRFESAVRGGGEPYVYQPEPFEGNGNGKKQSKRERRKAELDEYYEIMG